MVQEPASHVLFEITQENLETGMRGYPIGYCVTSSVDPFKGLFYVGEAIEKLAYESPEGVMALLWYGKRPDAFELDAFKEALKKRARLSEQVVEAIEALPRQGHPMKLFCMALLLAGMLDGKNDYKEDGLDLIAKIPHLTAVVINHHAGWGATPDPRNDLSYIENFVHMLQAPEKEKSDGFLDVMNLFNVLHYDHGGGNLSCFTGKAVASGLEDMWGSMSAAMAALAGPRHGKANQDCLEFVQQVYQELENNLNGDSVEKMIRDRLSKKELVYGFGHAVLRIEDPRATVQYEYAQKHFPHHPLIQTALLLRERGPVVLKENSKIADPYPNVDAISGSLLTASGFPYPEYYTVLFGMSRVVGIASQIVYERCEARAGKGTPIVRPKYLYKIRFSNQ
jgi:citrate synthase